MTFKRKNIQCVSTKGSVERVYPYASDKPHDIVDTFACTVRYMDCSTEATLYVISGRGVPLMSCSTGSVLGVLLLLLILLLLLQVGDVANVSRGFTTQWETEYPKVLGRVGKLTGTNIKLHTDEKV